MKKKILKIAIGEAYVNEKKVTVYQTAWRGDDGIYRMSIPIFVNEVETKDDKKDGEVVVDV